MNFVEQIELLRRAVREAVPDHADLNIRIQQHTHQRVFKRTSDDHFVEEQVVWTPQITQLTPQVFGFDVRHIIDDEQLEIGSFLLSNPGVNLLTQFRNVQQVTVVRQP